MYVPRYAGRGARYHSLTASNRRPGTILRTQPQDQIEV